MKIRTLWSLLKRRNDPEQVSYFTGEEDAGWRATFSEISCLMIYPIIMFMNIWVSIRMGAHDSEIREANVLLVVIVVTALFVTALGTTIIVAIDRTIVAESNEGLRLKLEALEQGTSFKMRHLQGIIRYCRDNHPEKPWASLLDAASIEERDRSRQEQDEEAVLSHEN